MLLQTGLFSVINIQFYQFHSQNLILVQNANKIIIKFALFLIIKKDFVFIHRIIILSIVKIKLLIGYHYTVINILFYYRSLDYAKN